MAESVLQSFVIRLTYAVDEVSSRKFQQGIQQGVQGLNGVRIAALAAIVGIEEMVRRTTNAYAPLDYLAKSSGTTASAIDRLGNLFIGAGMSAAQAQGTINSLGMEFQTTPGRMSNAANLVGDFGGNVTVFMERARDKLEAIVNAAGGDWQLDSVQKFLYELSTATNDQTKEQIIQLERQKAASLRFANEVDESWKKLNTTPEAAAAASAKANRELELLGKTLNIAFLELLTKKDDKGNSLLGTIVKIADAFQQWLINPETQKQFTAMFERLMTMMPTIEKSLDHLGPIVEAFLLIWVGSKALAMLGFFGQWRASVLGVLGPLTALSAAALFLPDKFLTPEQQKVRKEKFDDFRKWINRGFTGAKEGEEKLPPIAPSGQPTPQPLGPPRKHTVGDPLNWLGGIWQKLKEDYGKVGPGSRIQPLQRLQKGQPGSAAYERYERAYNARMKRLGFQHGGIVPINAHAGEMVLPTAISQGLQSFFSGGSGGLFDTSRRLLDQFVSWFAGDTSYKPQLELGDDTVDRWKDSFKDALHDAGIGPGSGRPPRNAPGGGPGGSSGPDTTLTGPSGAVNDKGNFAAVAVNEMRKAGWTEAAIKATLAVGLGEGGWTQSWAPSGIKGEASFGPYQFFAGGELPGYLKWAKENGVKEPTKDVAAQTRYFMKRANEITHGAYGKSTDVGAARASIRGTWHGSQSQPMSEVEQTYQRANAGITPDVPPTAPAPGAAAAPSTGTGFGSLMVAIGDSIADGVDTVLGLHGGAGKFADAVGGTTPKQIYERIHAHIKDYAGKSIALASGSNPNAGFDPSQMEAVKKTVQELHDVGANVVLVGVGAGVKDAAKINAQLGTMAKEFHYGFTGELEGTQRRGGVVHPDDYHKTIEQIKRAGQQVSSATWGADAASRIWGNKSQQHVVVKNDTHVHVAGNEGRTPTSKQKTAIYDRDWPLTMRWAGRTPVA